MKFVNLLIDENLRKEVGLLFCLMRLLEGKLVLMMGRLKVGEMFNR